MLMRTGATTSQIAQVGRVTPCAPPPRKSKRIGAHGVTRPTLLACAFTLIELILVMALLAIVLGISAPSLSRFFRTRGLDSEARRFLALTRAAQSRAVSEGVPMVLWFDSKSRRYGLNAEKSFVEEDPKAEQFAVDDTLEVEVRYSADAAAASRVSQFKNEKLDTGGLYTLRFNPDGFVSASSPEAVVFRQANNGELWVAQSRNRLNYEIQPGRQIASR
jgi:type II secretion system protein H